MLKVPHMFLLLGASLDRIQSKSGHYLIETADADDGKVMSSFSSMLHSFHNTGFQSTNLIHSMQLYAFFA